MLYFNHPLINANTILSYLQEHRLDFSSPGSSQLSKFQTKLRNLYFKHNPSAEIEDDLRFVNYPKLQAILTIILNPTLEFIPSLHALQNLDLHDWQADPAAFTELNQHYQYFPDNAKYQTLFSDLSQACRIHMTFFEKKNNTVNDKLAYTASYQLMALYLDPSLPLTSQLNGLYMHIHQLMKTTSTQDLQQLTPAHLLSDKPGWRKFLSKEKMPGLKYWRQAEKIEAINHGKAPPDLKEAKLLLLQCLYARAKEDLDFAKLCQTYQIPEHRFNQCLDYLRSGWPKKQKENIPNLQIRTPNQAWIWLKLPLKDKRHLILRDISNTYLSIDEHRIKDACELESHGFYVLMKPRRIKLRPVIIDDQINDQDYQILGQAHVWKSVLGNVCVDAFDYWARSECPLETLLTRFARVLFAADPKIQYLTLAQDRQYPLAFPPAHIPELMDEGESYTLSLQQYCIAKQELDEKPNQAKLQEFFPLASAYAIDYLATYANPEILAPSSELLRQTSTQINQDRIIQTLMLLKAKDLFNPVNLTTIINYPQSQEIISELCRKDFSGLLTGDMAQDNFTLIAKHSQPRQLMLALYYLQEAKLLTPRNQARLAKKDDLLLLVEALCCLQTAKMLSQINLNLIVWHTHLQVLTILLKQMECLNLDHFSRFACHPNPSELVAAVDFLYRYEILSAERMKLLGQHFYPQNLSAALCYLKQIWLLNPENQAVLVCHASPYELAEALGMLQEMGILNDANRNAVASHPQPQKLAEALNILQQAEILSDENRDLLTAHASPYDLAEALFRLHQADLLTPQNGRLLAEHPHPARLFTQIQQLKYTRQLSQTSLAALLPSASIGAHSLFQSPQLESPSTLRHQLK